VTEKRHAPALDPEWKLPCEVRLPNGMTIGRGVHLHTLLVALKRREEYAAEGLEDMLRFKRSQHTEVEQLQTALAFWLPNLPDQAHPAYERWLRDVCLLYGFSGQITESADELGWLRWTPPSHQAPDATSLTWSALSFRGRTICYHVDGDGIEARELGHRELLPIDDELRQAIEHDRAREARKRQEA
jgi:hypothetical protein